MHDSALLLEVCEELLRTGRRACFRVDGSSMGSAIRPGDRVEVAPLRGAEARPGMVVLYRGPRGPLVHRVVERRADGLILWGDAAEGPDAPVCPEQVVGQVIRVFAGSTAAVRLPVPAWIADTRRRLRSLRRALRCATLRQGMRPDRS